MSEFVTPRNVVMFSGGISSWAAARRIADEEGTAGLVLLFADTRMEDEDLYRFLDEAARDVGGELVRLADGRTPWDVFFDVRFLGNSRIDPCSRVLKRELCRRWLEEHCDPAVTAVHLGYDWTEEHRIERARAYWRPWRVEAPLMRRPMLARWQVRESLLSRGIAPPRLYAWAEHNNCGGFCVKAGQGHFRALLANMPERFAFHEAQEERFRREVAGAVAILRDRTGGDFRPLTLRELRERVEAGRTVDLFDIGGCGCFDEAEPS